MPANTDAVQLVSNIILFMMWGGFMCYILEARYNLWITWSAWMLACALWIIITIQFPVGTILRSVISPFIYFLAVLLLFRGRPIGLLFGAALSIMIMAMCELITVMIFPKAMSAPDYILGSSTGRQVIMFTVYLLLNAFFLWITALLFSRYRNRLSTRELLLYMLFPISQFILLIGWFGCAFRSMTTMDTLTEVIGAISCVAADTALYFAIRGMAERVELRVQNTMLEKQIDAQTVHYAALTEQYENIRRMRHDIDNHLYTMRILLENGKADEAASYLAELNPGSEYVPSLGRCHNPVVDAFLYTRIKDLRTQGIQVEADVDLPGEMTISNADLVSAFGNLLDNAAEAVHGAAQKRISITAGIKSGYLVIKTENPSSPAPDTQKRRIPELERGVGFHILTGLAEKYNGSFTACAEGSMFDTSLILQEMNALA